MQRWCSKPASTACARLLSAWHDIVHEVLPWSAFQCAILLDYLCLTYGPNDCRNPTKSAGPFGITEYIPDQWRGDVLLTHFGSLDLLPVWNHTWGSVSTNSSSGPEQTNCRCKNVWCNTSQSQVGVKWKYVARRKKTSVLFICQSFNVILPSSFDKTDATASSRSRSSFLSHVFYRAFYGQLLVCITTLTSLASPAFCICKGSWMESTENYNQLITLCVGAWQDGWVGFEKLV